MSACTKYSPSFLLLSLSMALAHFTAVSQAKLEGVENFSFLLPRNVMVAVQAMWQAEL